MAVWWEDERLLARCNSLLEEVKDLAEAQTMMHNFWLLFAPYNSMGVSLSEEITALFLSQRGVEASIIFFVLCMKQLLAHRHVPIKYLCKKL